MQRPAFQALLRRYQGQVNISGLDLKERIQLGAQEALARLHEVLREEEVEPEVLLRATTDLLDRSGYRPVRSKEVRSLDSGLSAQDLEEIKVEVNRREESIVERPHLKHPPDRP